MIELIRDTVFGHLVRFLSKGKLLQYAEEKDAKLWKQYLDRDQTRNMALHGNLDGPQLTPDEKEKEVGNDSSESSRTRTPELENIQTNAAQTRSLRQKETHEHQMSSTITGQRIDTEKGRDVTIVTWFGDDDPEVPPSRSPDHSSMTESRPDAA